MRYLLILLFFPLTAHAATYDISVQQIGIDGYTYTKTCEDIALCQLHFGVQDDKGEDMQVRADILFKDDTAYLQFAAPHGFLYVSGDNKILTATLEGSQAVTTPLYDDPVPEKREKPDALQIDPVVLPPLEKIADIAIQIDAAD